MQIRSPTEEELSLLRLLDEQYLETPFYGSRRMTVVLRQQGYPVNRKRVQRLMRQLGVEAIYPKPRLSQRHPDHQVFPYLLRSVSIKQDSRSIPGSPKSLVSKGTMVPSYSGCYTSILISVEPIRLFRIEYAASCPIYPKVLAVQSF